MSVFEPKKIIDAVAKAAHATHEFAPTEATAIGNHVANFIINARRDDDPVSIEYIQDAVERTLMAEGYFKTAKAYILYREKRRQSRETGSVVVNVEKTMQEHLDRSDWRVDANANQGYTLGGHILNTSGKKTAN